MKLLSLLAGALALLAAASGYAQEPKGTYTNSCDLIRVEGNILHARCMTMARKTVDASLNLPCNGSIDNIDGKLTCTGAPAAGVPQGRYLLTCADARVQHRTLLANCRRRDQTIAQASLGLPCGGQIENENGALKCVTTR